MPSKSKRCTTCKATLNIKFFSKDNSTKDGKRCQCKSCTNKAIKLRRQTKGYFSSDRKRFNAVSYQARYRGQTWDITFEEWRDLVADKTCTYCFGPLNQTGCSLDRMNSSIGYMIGNVTPCCKKCNEFKSDVLSYEEMFAVMALLRKMRSKNESQPLEIGRIGLKHSIADEI